jgi:hypothetical protein
LVRPFKCPLGHISCRLSGAPLTGFWVVVIILRP